jgi:excisionase family DNA binding protein
MPEGLEVLTLRQVADELKCHPVTVRNLIKRGNLEGFRIGRRWRVTREALTRFTESRRWSNEERRNDA